MKARGLRLAPAAMVSPQYEAQDVFPAALAISPSRHLNSKAIEEATEARHATVKTKICDP